MSATAIPLSRKLLNQSRCSNKTNSSSRNHRNTDQNAPCAGDRIRSILRDSKGQDRECAMAPNSRQASRKSDGDVDAAQSCVRYSLACCKADRYRDRCRSWCRNRLCGGQKRGRIEMLFPAYHEGPGVIVLEVSAEGQSHPHPHPRLRFRLLRVLHRRLHARRPHPLCLPLAAVSYLAVTQPTASQPVPSLECQSTAVPVSKLRLSFPPSVMPKPYHQETLVHMLNNTGLLRYICLSAAQHPCHQRFEALVSTILACR